MKVHERYFVTQTARIEFEKFILELERKYQLTFGEITSIFAVALTQVAKYQIRAERHPDDLNKKGDEA